MMLNVANPAEAFSLSFLPNDGVGLARLEFIISNHVRTCTRWRSPPRTGHRRGRPAGDRAADGRLRRPGQYFVDRLAEGVGDDCRRLLAEGRHRPAVGLQDERVREPARRRAFEPEEENPMIGFRGASRYYDPRYREGFALECRAMRKVREEMGLENVKLMVPFCRTVEEGAA
jgi:pyruvate, water dikinase